MKTSKRTVLGVIFLVTFSIFSSTAGDLTSKKNSQSQYPNYVVIGAFSIHKNAINFTNTAVKNKYPAKYEKNFNRNLFYVYVMITDNHEEAIAEALRLRSESPYFDSWVYNGVLGKEGKDITGTDINPVTAQQINNVESNEENTRSINSEASPTQQIIPEETDTTSTKIEEPIKTTPKVDEPDDEIEGKKFYFKLFRADNAEPVEGDVNVIDALRARKMGSYEGNKSVKVSSPNNKDGSMSVVCQVFGYRKVQHDFNYDNPQGDEIQTDEEKGVVVPFELIRLQKGDHAIMYNVFFFKDASIMRPESRYEVGSLLDMLKENPKYKIKIHGHTNGNHAGKIISMAEGSENFFALNNTVEGSGSAKKLSGERAEIIKAYLLSNGIEENRMQIKAWGGKRALYDKHSAQAQANVRVEIEILDN